ncbi:MAG TPA: HAMP domain-containing sensor histidine kinase [Actinomycetota bacterium]
MSLRARLLITTVLVAAAGLLVADAATYRFLSSFLVHRVDEQLVASRNPAAHALSIEAGFGPSAPAPDVVLPDGTYAELRNASGETVVARFFRYGDRSGLPPALPAVLPGSAGSIRSVRTFSTTAMGGAPPEYRVLATSLGPDGGTLVVAIPMTQVGVTLHRLLFTEITVSAAVLAALAALSLWLVRLGLRPLEGMGETAGAIAAGDLSRRVEPAEDRTEVGRLGLALNAMLAQIEAAFEERRASEQRLRRFVADASHELRTPLTSIRGYAELFRRGADSRPEDLAKSMQRIEAEASRMGILVDDLLLLARLDQGRPLERERVDLSRVAADAVDGARAVEPDRSVDLEVEDGAVVLGDDGRLRQVVDNLLDNVRVHTPPGAAAHVRVSRDGDDVVLVVADEGPGLDPETAARVFERFYRGDPSRSRSNGGAGLGLSIVAAIVEAHGGTVLAGSPEGGGARLEVRIPAAPSGSSQSELPPPPPGR